MSVPLGASPAEVGAAAAGCGELAALNRVEAGCFACPRLVEWREQVAQEKRASYVAEEYWGRPITGFGDPDARLVVVGLAPAAHGGNRTGRVFTGDRSADWVFRALHKAGYANQPESVAVDDGLHVTDAWITAAVRCAPPANKPTPHERLTCAPYLARELELLTRARVLVLFGSFAYQAIWSVLGGAGHRLPSPRPKFGHGVEVRVGDLMLLCSYHPSQQNTFTGKLTEQMFDAVFARARELAAGT